LFDMARQYRRIVIAFIDDQYALFQMLHPWAQLPRERGLSSRAWASLWFAAVRRAARFMFSK
jgi:hypothetical protein